RNIHDHAGQQLTALRLSLERHERTLGRKARPDLDQARAITQDMDRELDFLTWQLRPAALDDLGLAVALGKYLEAWAPHHGRASGFRTSGLDGDRLPAAAETTFYRVAQEALNNVAKHAHASRVDLILEYKDGTSTLVIEDDGVGFDGAESVTEIKGLGLVGMRERAALIGGVLALESAAGQGTTPLLSAPGAPHARAPPE